MRPRLLGVLHAASEPLGALEEPLRSAGIDLDVRLASESLPASLDGYAGLLVMGGPMGVYEADRHPHLKAEIALLREALEQDVAALGICLGAQLLAASGGARVYRGPAPEVGFWPVRLLAHDPWLPGWPTIFEPLHLHGDSFDLPAGARLLAASERYTYQAFRLGSALGLQFHVEATEAMATEWLSDPSQPPAWRVDAAQLARTPEAARRMAPLVDALAGAFAAAVVSRQR